MEWRKRNDLNFCYNCWFGAKIESKITSIGERFICLNCGFTTTDLEVAPRYFTDEQWNEFWSKNFKIEE